MYPLETLTTCYPGWYEQMHDPAVKLYADQIPVEAHYCAIQEGYDQAVGFFQLLRDRAQYPLYAIEDWEGLHTVAAAKGFLGSINNPQPPMISKISVGSDNTYNALTLTFYKPFDEGNTRGYAARADYTIDLAFNYQGLAVHPLRMRIALTDPRGKEIAAPFAYYPIRDFPARYQVPEIPNLDKLTPSLWGSILKMTSRWAYHDSTGFIGKDLWHLYLYRFTL